MISGDGHDTGDLPCQVGPTCPLVIAAVPPQRPAARKHPKHRVNHSAIAAHANRYGLAYILQGKQLVPPTFGSSTASERMDALRRCIAGKWRPMPPLVQLLVFSVPCRRP